MADCSSSSCSRLFHSLPSLAIVGLMSKSANLRIVADRLRVWVSMPDRLADLIDDLGCFTTACTCTTGLVLKLGKGKGKGKKMMLSDLT